ncbi:MAG: DUF1634 domain-containing protein [Terriglobia bacterium]
MQANERPASRHVTKAEQKIYADVYDVLTVGMVASSILYALGVILALLHPRTIPLTREFIMRNYKLGEVLHGLAHLHPGALMFVATVILILTPVSRVVISIYAFYSERDTKYVVVTGIVFLVIVLTVCLGVMGLQ